ncbi:MAG: AAA family ATPase [Parachlamydiales bacterium]|nr:AAA family ATPase [Verrucomicrobiota bacterium]MBX3719988.1 AAA family ATPase [Candidatus Acheromyda pituitae]
MIAGPNGAGKTTMTLELISKQSMLYEFINADEIARGLAPMHPESMALTASKLMLKRLKELLDADKSFAFETTGSGTNYVKYLRSAQSRGYEISLTFLWLMSPHQAVKRVKQRVKQGGHHVPEETIIRRYHAGLKNLLAHYLPLADRALIMDNSLEDSKKRPIARKKFNCELEILDKVIWEKIERGVHER